MSSQVEILRQEFESLRQELIERHDELGMRASGTWAASLEVNVSEGDNTISAQLIGAPYSQQLETGRAPGRMPPTTAIEQWIIDKGIAARIEGNMKVSTLAYLIARKIAREGWKREQYGGVELISQVVTPERIQKIIDKASDIYVPEFSNQIIEYLKTAA